MYQYPTPLHMVQVKMDLSDDDEEGDPVDHDQRDESERYSRQQHDQHPEEQPPHHNFYPSSPQFSGYPPRVNYGGITKHNRRTKMTPRKVTKSDPIEDTRVRQGFLGEGTNQRYPQDRDAPEDEEEDDEAHRHEIQHRKHAVTCDDVEPISVLTRRDPRQNYASANASNGWLLRSPVTSKPVPPVFAGPHFLQQFYADNDDDKRTNDAEARHFVTAPPVATLPYMGQMTLDNEKPRRGRKPKKTDICHLITKNYGGQQLPPRPGRTPSVADAGLAPSNNNRHDSGNSMLYYTAIEEVVRITGNGNNGSAASVRNGKPSRGPPPLRRIFPTSGDGPQQRSDGTKRESSTGQANKVEIRFLPLQRQNASDGEFAATRSNNDICFPPNNDHLRASSGHGEAQKTATSCSSLASSVLRYREQQREEPVDTPQQQQQQQQQSTSTPILLQALRSRGTTVESSGTKRKVPPPPEPQAALTSHIIVQRRPQQQQKPGAATSSNADATRTRNVNKNKQAEVSICKFKFTAGPCPTLEKKKMLSVDSGGKFHFYSVGTASTTTTTTGGGAGQLGPPPAQHNPQPPSRRRGSELEAGRGAARGFRSSPATTTTTTAVSRTGTFSGGSVTNVHEFITMDAPREEETVTSDSGTVVDIKEERDDGSSGNAMLISNSEEERMSTTTADSQGLPGPTEETLQDSSRRIETRSRTRATPKTNYNHPQNLRFQQQPERHRQPHRRHQVQQHSPPAAATAMAPARRRPGLRRKMEETFKDKGFLIQTQKLDAPQGGTFCKFRQLKKFTRYLFRNWKDHLPTDEAAAATAADGSQNA